MGGDVGRGVGVDVGEGMGGENLAENLAENFGGDVGEGVGGQNLAENLAENLVDSSNYFELTLIVCILSQISINFRFFVIFIIFCQKVKHQDYFRG